MHDRVYLLAVLLACHNRRKVTLACLERLYQLRLPKMVKMSIILVDDGSQDGTSQDVMSQFPEVNLLKGNGQLYWSGSMRFAMEEAIDQKVDFLLWLNDDTSLYSNSITELFFYYERLLSFEGVESILVGSTQDSTTKTLTYGGVRRNSWWQPLRFKRITPGEHLKKCDTFNGNIVFFPKSVPENVGNLDPGFTHGIGDYDYGLRAQKAGIQAWVAPGYLGTCSRNLQSEGWAAQRLTYRERWSKFINVKGVPVLERMRYVRRHGGLFWPLIWLGPYVKFPIRHFLYRLGIK